LIRGRRRPLIHGLIISFIFAALPPVRAGEPSESSEGRIRAALRTFGADGRYLFTFPQRTSAKGIWLTSAFAAGTLLLIEQDDAIREEVLEVQDHTAARIIGEFEPLGNSVVEGAALGIAWLSARNAGRPRATEATGTAFEAYLWTLVITSVSKAAFGRARPSEGTGAHGFWEGDTIFPSGHTSRSFAIAAVFADRYGRPAAAIGYPLAALVGLSTMQRDTHWASDILAGAGLGLAIGKGIASRRRPAIDGGGRGEGDIAWQVVPAGGGLLLHLSY
jgi:membrane-associated phospholipid phosphatase